MKLAIDVSYYNWLTRAQWLLLKTITDGVIIRTSYGVTIDVMADEHVAMATELGLPYAAYHWADPTWDFNRQLATFLQGIDTFKPAGIFNDYEQWWRNWKAYMAQDYATALLTKFSPTEINAWNTKWHTTTSGASPVPVGQYSADWFINSWSPGMANWVTKGNYWEARYMRYYDKAYLAAKKAEWGIPFAISHVKELGLYCGVNKGIGRQFESYLEVKGLEWNNWHMDYNVFTDEGFAKMFGTSYTPVPIPPTPVPTTKKYRVTATAINVRRTPNGTIFAWKVYGQIVEVPLLPNGLPEIVYGWAHIINPDGWVYASNLAPI